MRITVCRDCTERYHACHDTCEKYQGQLKEEKEAYAKYKKEHAGDRQLKVMSVDKKTKRLKRYKEKTW